MHRLRPLHKCDQQQKELKFRENKTSSPPRYLSSKAKSARFQSFFKVQFQTPASRRDDQSASVPIPAVLVGQRETHKVPQTTTSLSVQKAYMAIIAYYNAIL